MSEALRGLSEWITTTTSIDLSGKGGNGGKSAEKPSPLPNHQISPSGNGGKDDADCLTTLTSPESAVVSEKPPKTRDLTTLTILTTQNDGKGRCATSETGEAVAADLAWLSPSARTAFIASPDSTVEVRHRQTDGQWSPPLIERLPPFEPRRAPSLAKDDVEPEPPNGWGLSRYTIRDLAIWYEEEANRRRNGIELDQKALDRDLRARVRSIGVFPEFVAVEFERVMRVVFAVPTPPDLAVEPAHAGSSAQPAAISGRMRGGLPPQTAARS